ncbi:unnamed protein product [Rangifer tarandus platyrhynchus]|uniref:Uncharacterized protein n=1 Tax=Rangifer tarandus platyrhynchus TaxID=3082113 RepID=A0AC59Z675_RANTA
MPGPVWCHKNLPKAALLSTLAHAVLGIWGEPTLVLTLKEGRWLLGCGGKDCGQKVQSAGGVRRQSGKASWRSGPGADEGTVCAKAWGWESGLPPTWGPCEDGGGGWAGCPGSLQAAGFGGGKRRELGTGEPL